MARAKAITTRSRTQKAETLIALGAERLADLILTQIKVDPVFGRTVRMALAAKDDPSALAHEIDKRLKTIRRSTSFSIGTRSARWRVNSISSGRAS